MKKFSSQRGYTLLFSVLVATLVLGVTVFILSVSRKQFILSATARDSMNAIYAADAGLECVSRVIYSMDIKSGPTVLPCNSPDDVTIPLPQGTLLADSETPEGFELGTNSAYQVKDIFVPLYRGPTGSREVYGCVVMTITIGIDASNAPSERRVVQSRGYNLCTSTGPDTSSSRTVERALQMLIR